MAKKIQTKNNNRESNSFFSVELKQETKYGIYAIGCFILTLFFILSAFKKAGVVGEFNYKIFSQLFGFGYFLLPLTFIFLGYSFVKSERPKMGFVNILSSLFFILSSLSIIDLIQAGKGGVLGKILSYPFYKFFGIYASYIFLFGIIFISLIVLFDKIPNFKFIFEKIGNIFKRKQKVEIEEEEEEDEDATTLIIDEEEEEEDVKEEKVEEEEKEEKNKKSNEVKTSKEEDESGINPSAFKFLGNGTYVPPPLSILEKDSGKPNVGDVKSNINIIKRTLQNFGIEVEMDEVTIGPTVSRYSLKPAEGVKLSKILGLQNDLALALAAATIRIQAPIPGKSLVGIEIPNKVKAMVGLASLVMDEKFLDQSKPMTVALGRNVSGKASFGNLAKMPHALIAGTTGSGKSVTIHTIITSLLYRAGPENLRFIMVDPKRVELTLYNGIPHLLTPVITEPKKAILSLKWAAKEMDRRYDVLEKHSVRDIQSYHSNILAKHKNKADESEIEAMPYIVIIIDELADIMTTYPRELEAGIVRLAQMSRAVGIHLILSTQRPSVNVITGLIKANVPTRIALQVASQIDSRTIIDMPGAEKLLGAGDMLYSSSEMSQPERIQSAFITEDEVKKVVKYLINAYKDEVISDINLTNGTVTTDKTIFESVLDDETNDDDDELYEEAKQTIIEAGRASTSYLQRKLKVGYARAARLMDMLEERGVIGAADGAKPREVLGGSEANNNEEPNF